jgi:hypothetical protein
MSKIDRAKENLKDMGLTVFRGSEPHEYRVGCGGMTMYVRSFDLPILSHILDRTIQESKLTEES